MSTGFQSPLDEKQPHVSNPLISIPELPALGVSNLPKRTSNKSGSELFIVDNSEEDWKALRYLHDWCQISRSLDVASGFFEVGALLALDGEWQKLDHIPLFG